MEEEFQQDWYSILNCSKVSTKGQIERSARKLFLRYHPDKTSEKDAPEKFLLVQKAKEILLDPNKRKLIDEKIELNAKRKEYETNRNKNMNDKRKKMKEDFEEKLHKLTKRETNVNKEMKTANLSKVVEELRKQNEELLEKSKNEENLREKLKREQFLKHRSLFDDNGPIKSCQVRIKWKRKAISHSDDTIFQLFKQFGTIEDVSLVGSSGTSALVTFTTSESAKAAINFFEYSEEFQVYLLSDYEKSKKKSTIFTFDFTGKDKMVKEIHKDVNEPDEDVESLLLKNMRRAVERQELLRSLEREEENVKDIRPHVNKGHDFISSQNGEAKLNKKDSETNGMKMPSKLDEVDILKRMMEAANSKTKSTKMVEMN